jgi:hypothetical protein
MAELVTVDNGNFLGTLCTYLDESLTKPENSDGDILFVLRSKGM